MIIDFLLLVLLKSISLSNYTNILIKNIDMKKLFSTLILMSFVFLGYSQSEEVAIWKLKTDQFSMMFKQSTTDEWTDWEKTSTIIVIDHVDRVIKIFANEYSVYDILAVSDLLTDEDGDEYVAWETLNKKGKVVTMRYLVYKPKNDTAQFYIHEE